MASLELRNGVSNHFFSSQEMYFIDLKPIILESMHSVLEDIPLLANADHNH